VPRRTLGVPSRLPGKKFPPLYRFISTSFSFSFTPPEPSLPFISFPTRLCFDCFAYAYLLSFTAMPCLFSPRYIVLFVVLDLSQFSGLKIQLRLAPCVVHYRNGFRPIFTHTKRIVPFPRCVVWFDEFPPGKFSDCRSFL